MDKKPNNQGELPHQPKSGQVVSFTKTPASILPAKSDHDRPTRSVVSIWTFAKWILALAAVAALGWYFGANYVLGPVVKTDVIKRQNVVQTVVASGQVFSPFRVSIGAQVAGLVKAVPVAEGQTVKMGDLLIQLDDTDAHEALALAQAVVAQSRAKLEEITITTLPIAQEAQAQAQAVVDSAQINFDRADKLFKQDAGTGQAVDDARKALSVAQSQLRSAELQVAAALPSGTGNLAAQAQYNQAIASQHSAEAKFGYYKIFAPRDGTLTTRNVEVGNTVQPGAVLMVLAPSGKTQVDMQIDEVNLGLLKIGQPAAISADAYPKQNFTGLVSYISPAVDPATGSVDVKLDVANPPDYLLQTMTVSAEIEVARRDNAIVVSATNVHDLSGAKPWVMAVENGRTQHRAITVGTIGDDAVQVLDGLMPGDLILRGQALDVSDGQRVRLPSNG